MSFLKSFDISSSALTAQRLRMDVVAENIANINTTRTANGDPYRRRYVLFQEREGSFSDFYKSAMNADKADNGVTTSPGRGVRVTAVMEEDSPFKIEYNPGHPDADEQGYVRLPNVDLAREMIDMMSATRSYEANITAVNAFKNMATQALQIGK